MQLLAYLAVAAVGQPAEGANILVNTGTADVTQTGVTWNNLTTSSSGVALNYTDGTASGLTYTGATGTALSNDIRLTSAATLGSHPLTWVSSLTETERGDFSTNFSQNVTTYSNLNFTGMNGFTGKYVTIEVMATYNATGNSRRADLQVNGQFTTRDGGTVPTYKPSDDFQVGYSNLNYTLWENIVWGATTEYSGDGLTISFRRSNNTAVINGFSIDINDPPSPNVVDNSGFITTTDPWTVAGNTQEITVSNNTDRDIDGDGWYLRMLNTNESSNSGAFIYQVVDVVGGTSYDFSVHARYNGSNAADLQLDVFDGDVTGNTDFLNGTTLTGGLYSATEDLTSSYQSFGLTGITPTSNQVTIRMYDLAQNSTSSDIWVDNAMLIGLIPEPSTFALAAVGLLGLLACGRRRRR